MPELSKDTEAIWNHNNDAYNADPQSYEPADLKELREKIENALPAVRLNVLERWAGEVRLAIKRMDATAQRETKIDTDGEEVITGYRFKTGAFHALLGLLSQMPAVRTAQSVEVLAKVVRELVEWRDWPEVQGAFALAFVHGQVVSRERSNDAVRRWDNARAAAARVEGGE